MQEQEVEKIDPTKTYSLYTVVKNGWLGGARTYPTAHMRVYEDLLSEEPVLQAKIDGKGRGRSVTIEGKNLVRYQKMLSDTSSY